MGATDTRETALLAPPDCKRYAPNDQASLGQETICSPHHPTFFFSMNSKG